MQIVCPKKPLERQFCVKALLALFTVVETTKSNTRSASWQNYICLLWVNVRYGGARDVGLLEECPHIFMRKVVVFWSSYEKEAKAGLLFCKKASAARENYPSKSIKFRPRQKKKNACKKRQVPAGFLCVFHLPSWPSLGSLLLLPVLKNWSFLELDGSV